MKTKIKNGDLTKVFALLGFLVWCDAKAQEIQPTLNNAINSSSPQQNDKPTPPAKLDLDFDTRSPPSIEEWRQFMALSNVLRQELWQTTRLQSKDLKDWSWKWRLGWLRVCQDENQEAFCKNILKQALTDEALVVRAQAAVIFGRIFEASGDKNALQALETSFRNPLNYRRGKPLYIQERILFAIKKIGGPNSESIAEQLAQDNKITQAYWKKIKSVKF